MAGLLLLVTVGAWLLLCFHIAKNVAKASRPAWARTLVASGAFVGLLVAPIADDILGTVRYKQYCAAADEVKFVGTLHVSADAGLHSASGEWLLSKLEPSQHDERSRIQSRADNLVRWDHGTDSPTASLFPIDERTTRIYDAASQRLLAEWKSYHYRGGLLRRTLLGSSSQCFPNHFGSAMYEKIFAFRP